MAIGFARIGLWFTARTSLYVCPFTFWDYARMSDILIGALISLVAVAIISPFANHYLSKRREKPAQLEIVVSANAHEVSKFLAEHLRRTLPPYGEDDKVRDTLVSFSRCGCYVTFTLYNRSNRKLSGVSVRIENEPIGGLFFQVDDGPGLFGPRERVLPVGDILPHQSRVLHCWTTADLSSYSYATFENWFNFSANELDSRAYSFYLPTYLLTKEASKKRSRIETIMAYARLPGR